MTLPTTGTPELLHLLSEFVPDDLINNLLPRHRGAGRHNEWSAGQLYRVLLLLLLTPTRSSNLLCSLLSDQRSWRRFAHLPNRRKLPGARQLHEFRTRLTPSVLRHINEHLLERLLKNWPSDQPGVALIDATDLPASTNEYNKGRGGRYSARKAALGGRTKKTGQSRWFIGYKKHTLRLWLAHYTEAVLLVPLMTWAVPANRGEALFLRPSLQYCAKRLGWLPKWVVGDMAYISLAEQRRIREELDVAVVTRLRPDMHWMEPYGYDGVPRCPQGQQLEWLGYEKHYQQQWFGALPGKQSLCSWCWDQARCEREFGYPASAHEILFGLLPQAAPLAKHLLEKVRPWVEPAQSFEKHQLGLRRFFLNSLHLTWVMTLLADAVVLMRAQALLSRPPEVLPLGELTPNQLEFPYV